jgi:hypothetical protein
MSTQGDIAEADVFNATWSSTSIPQESALQYCYFP